MSDIERPLAAVILAGGAGTRFWPASTDGRPKQFLTLVGDRSMLQLAYDRLVGLVPPDRVFVVTHQRFVPEVMRHLPEVPANNIVGEPLRRDTAAAVALAALLVAERLGPSTLAVLTADHLITPVDAFAECMRAAVKHCTPEHAVTFGIVPTGPATGYGYLELAHEGDVAPVVRFHEKPELEIARRYVETGRHVWNSGMFVFDTQGLLGALAHHLPRHVELLRPVLIQGAVDPRLLEAAFAALPAVSIDKGLMEKLDGTRCVRARFAWSDVGSFPALRPFLDDAGAGNAARARLHTLDAQGNVVWSADPTEVVALVGVHDLVVVRAGPRTLVVPVDRAEDVKRLVAALPENER